MSAEIQATYLSEHESGGKGEGKTPGYNPTPEEKEIIRRVESRFNKNKKFRQKYDQNWMDNHRMLRGHQWKDVRPSYRSSEVLNLTWEAVQSMVPILVDGKPKLEYLPTVPSQFQLADILSKVVAHDWDSNNWLMTLIECIYDSHEYGTGLAEMPFNPKAEAGLGGIEFESVDPAVFYPDPEARNMNGKWSSHMIKAEPVPVSRLKREYKDNPNAKFIAADVIDFTRGEKGDVYQTMFRSPIDSKLVVEGTSAYDGIEADSALKITMWDRDDTLCEEEKPRVNEDGTPVIGDDGQPLTDYVQKLQYPFGRKTVIAGGVLLEDGPKQYEDDMFEQARLVNYMAQREFWGISEIDNLRGPQRTFNKLVAYTIDVLSLMSNPIWVIDDTANIDTDNLFNKPGLVVEKAQGAEARREAGVEIPSYVLPLIDRYRMFFNGISGQTDLSKGVEPANVTAAQAIEDLQQAQQTRLRLKSKHIDAFLQDLGKLYLSRVFQYYSVPRIVMLSGNPDAKDYFYFHVEKLEDGTKVAVVTKPDGTAALRQTIEGEFKVRVSTGSSLPFAKRAQGSRSMELFKLGIFDEEEVLKELEIPNWEKILQRVEQKKAQTQKTQMEMAMAMQKAKVEESMAKTNKTHVEAAAIEHNLVTQPIRNAAEMSQGRESKPTPT